MKNRNFFITLILSLFACLIGAFFTACDNTETSQPTSGSSAIENSESNEEDGLSFKTLSVNGTNVYGKVSNETTEFSFINEVKAHGNAKFIVALDIYGSLMVATKTIPLNVGDNTVYVIEMLDNEPTAVYTVTVRRRPLYYVTFHISGGTIVENQTIEEDSLANKPDKPVTTRAGYTFTGWDYDFSKPITQNTKITAKFEVKAEMSNFNFTSTATTCEIIGLKDKSVTKITIPDYVTSVDDYAFYGCSSLTSVVIGDGVTSIGYYAFYGCSSLTSIEIPDGVTSIGDETFRGCSSLKSVEIGNGVTRIGCYMFSNCSSLTSVTIHDGVTSISNSAFAYCSSLTSVTIPDSVTSIGDETFRGCYKLVEVVNKSTYITVKKGSTSNGYIGYYALAVYNSGDTFTTKLSNDNGYIVYTDGSEKILVHYTGMETDLVLPTYITKINRLAFSSCWSLTSIAIPDSVTSIGESAFNSCDSLTSVAIPDSVTSIGDSAFSGCRSLTSVVIGDSVTYIGFCAFFGCSSLTSITFKDTSTWYTTTNESGWENKTGGTVTSVTTPSTNATHFKSTYYNYYWYKL